MSNQLLQLMEHVIIDCLLSVFLQLFFLAIIDTEKVIAQGWDHEELLHHGVHVADAAKILETNIGLGPLKRVSTRRCIKPCLRLLDCLDKWYQVLL